MEKSRFTLGLDYLNKIDGQCGQEVIDSLKNIAPDLGQWIIEFAFGDIYSRKELTLKEREMVTLSSLLTLGSCEAQLNAHINGALNIGLSPKTIIEIFLQCIPYVGFPKVLNAVFVAKQIFQDKSIL